MSEGRIARGELTDEQWERLSPHLPTGYHTKRKKLKRRPGRPWKDHRTVVNGILWVLRTGAPWADLPERYGPHQTCWWRFARWKQDGTWDRILAALQSQAEDRGEIEWSNTALDGSYIRAHQHSAGARRPEEKVAAGAEEKVATGTEEKVAAGAEEKKGRYEAGDGGVERPERVESTPETQTEEAALTSRRAAEALGRSRGGLTTKINLMCEGQGKPLTFKITPGNLHDSTTMEAVLDDVSVKSSGRGRPRKRPDSANLDKGYSYKKCRAALRRRGISAMVPERKDQRENRKKKGRKGGRPAKYDGERYAKRNVVERCLCRLKGWRRIATRYDKRAAHFEAFVTLACILIWLGA